MNGIFLRVNYYSLILTHTWRNQEFQFNPRLIFETFDLSSQLRPRFQKLVFPEGIPYQRNKGFGTTKLGLIFKLNQQFKKRKMPKKSQVGGLRKI